MKVYLDNCCYNRPYDEQRQMRVILEAQAKLFIQRLIVEKKLELAVSYVSRYENSLNPEIERREAINKFFRNAAVYIDKEWEDKAKTIAEEIMKMRVSYNDALHIACSILAECDLFITTDDDIIKRYNGEMIVCNPVKFIEQYGGTHNA
jgi:predicted nucleic acid-binding protein